MGKPNNKKKNPLPQVGTNFREVAEISGLKESQVVKFASTGKGISTNNQEKIIKTAGGQNKWENMVMQHMDGQN